MNQQYNPDAVKKPIFRVLFCTVVGRRYGMGHLRRCISLIEEGRNLFESAICIQRGSRGSYGKLRDIFPRYTFVRDIAEAGEVDLILSDLREAGKKVKPGNSLIKKSRTA